MQHDTHTRIEEIRQRCEASAKGPWCWFGNTETHVVHLATDHSGRLYLLQASTTSEEYVYDHISVDSSSLARARERFSVCPDDHKSEIQCEHCDQYVVDEGHADDCSGSIAESLPDCTRCKAARSFLAANIDTLAQPGEALHLDDPVTGEHWMSRGVMIRPDLRFQDHERGLVRSWRDLARYEVLDGKTRAEAGLGPDADRSNSPLYREDIVGIDNPEAVFIAHSREDMDFLLGEVDRLRGQLGRRVCDCGGEVVADPDPDGGPVHHKCIRCGKPR